jgi:hypothetical protein
MTLGGVNPEDIVLVDRKGRRFYAVVILRRERQLEVSRSIAGSPTAE